MTGASEAAIGCKRSRSNQQAIASCLSEGARPIVGALRGGGGAFLLFVEASVTVTEHGTAAPLRGIRYHIR